MQDKLVALVREVDVIFTYRANPREADSLIHEVEAMGGRQQDFAWTLATLIPSPTMSPNTPCCVAPSAMRTPISCVRWLTEYASTP